jgi:hypothetical protein
VDFIYLLAVFAVCSFAPFEGLLQIWEASTKFMDSVSTHTNSKAVAQIITKFGTGGLSGTMFRGFSFLYKNGQN